MKTIFRKCFFKNAKTWKKRVTRLIADDLESYSDSNESDEE